MISLNSSMSLEMALGGAVSANELEFQISYIDTANDEVGSNNGISNGNSDVVLASPPSSGYRLIRQFSIYNADIIPAIVTVKLDDGVNQIRIAVQELSSGQTLEYNSESGLSIAFAAGVAVDDSTKIGFNIWQRKTVSFTADVNSKYKFGPGIIITMPPANDGDEIWLVPLAGVAAGNVVINPDGTDTLIGDTSLTVTNELYGFSLIYDEIDKDWRYR